MKDSAVELSSPLHRGRQEIEPLLSYQELEWFRAGVNSRLFARLGAHYPARDPLEELGASFAVWAPDVAQVLVVGDFNESNSPRHPLRADGTGFWTGFIPGVSPGAAYKYDVTAGDGHTALISDPCAFWRQTGTEPAAVVCDLTYPWRDSPWMEARGTRQNAGCPMALYEVDLASWMRVPEAHHRLLTYREIAPRLADYLQRHGFTHVQLATPCPSLFSPDPRAGSPQDFMFLIDILHQEGIGVVLSWDPSLAAAAQPHGWFHNETLEENALSGRGLDYGSPEMRSFLLSSAAFWLDQFHVDGLFVDLDLLNCGKRAGADGENDLLPFLQQFNEAIGREFPDVQTGAKDSTHGSEVSQPVNRGGLGFGFRWDVEWNRDTLGYLSRDPIFRKHHHGQFNRRASGTPAEKVDRTVLALSHHDVQREQGSLLRRMPGDDWQRFANLRLLFAYQWALPGKKLVFMGAEFGQWNEWDPERSLDWHLVQPGNHHNGVQKLIGHLNWLYRHEPALQRDDPSRDGFEWVDTQDAEQSTLGFLRKGEGSPEDLILALFNFTPVPRHNLRFGVPRGGFWREILNTDAVDYGGSGQGNLGGIESSPFGWQSRAYSLHVTLPPLGAVFLRQTTADPGPQKVGVEL